MDNNIKRFIVIIMLGVFFLLVINNSINRHNHIVAGYLYSHSHPFNKSNDDLPKENHTHSIYELVILDLLSDSEYLQILIASFFLALTGFVFIKLSYPVSRLGTSSLSELIPRAPPV